MAEHNASAAYADYTPLQRLALLAWWLALGEVVTTDKAAVVLGVSRDAAHAQLWRLAGVVAIAAEHDRWQRYRGQHLRRPPATTDERGAVLAWYLADGFQVSNAQAGELAGLGGRQAGRLLDKLALVLPVYYAAGLWRSCDDRPAYPAESGRCFYCGGVEVLTTGVVGGVRVLWCASCAGVYRALKGAR